jgi:hypothetical protein
VYTVEYFIFTHGGEEITCTLFWDVVDTGMGPNTCSKMPN